MHIFNRVMIERRPLLLKSSWRISGGFPAVLTQSEEGGDVALEHCAARADAAVARGREEQTARKTSLGRKMSPSRVRPGLGRNQGVSWMETNTNNKQKNNKINQIHLSRFAPVLKSKNKQCLN